MSPTPESSATRLRRWLAGRTRSLGWLRPLARWQARQRWLPYDLRFRVARWINLLTLDAGLPAVVDDWDRRKGLRFQLDLRDAAPWLTYYFGAYQPHVLNAAVALISPEVCCLELGAHIGLHTLFIAQRYATWGQRQAVVAFEPSPTAYALLSTHVSQNQLDDTVRHYPVAVSDGDGEARFFLSGGSNSANSALRDLHEAPTSTQDGRWITVKTVRLDTFWQRPPTPKPVGLIKADVEGAELLAFRGATSLIQACRPAVLFEAHLTWMSRFGYGFGDMVSFFASLNYEVYVLNEWSPQVMPAGQARLTGAADCLAAPAERADALLAEIRAEKWRR